MCFSFKTSIISYSLGMLSAIFALCTKQFVLGMLILFYCQMQLSEAFIWKGIDTNNRAINKTGTSYGKYLLATHNIGIGLGIILQRLADNRALRPFDFIPLLVGILFFMLIVCIYYLPNNYANITLPEDKSCKKRSCQNYKDRLLWPYPHSWYIYSFIISLIIFLVYIRSFGSKIFLSIVFAITFAASLLIYPKSVGSVWCFSTAILAPFLVIINNLLVSNRA